MNKFLFFTFIFAFSASLSAQNLSAPKASDLKKDGVEALSKEKPNLDEQIKDALMKDEEFVDEIKSNRKAYKNDKLIETVAKVFPKL